MISFGSRMYWLGGAWMGVVIAITLTIPTFREMIFVSPFGAVVLAATLILLSAIDAATQRLPDVLTLPLIGAGLIWSGGIGWSALFLSAMGAVIGYAIIAGLNGYWRWRRGVEGIGLGDAKLLAAGGAWCGLVGLPFILLISSAAGLLVSAFTLKAIGKETRPIRTARIPFGPFLALGIWTVWAWRPDVLSG